MHDEFSRARRDKDAEYDGKFYFGVTTTGIFCRPSCPAPEAHEENVEYFATPYEAVERGYRPCRRCRPDIEVERNTGNPSGTLVVDQALARIRDGALNRQTLDDLSSELQVSTRHLRQLFIENLGAPPMRVINLHRALFAKRLLLSSSQRVTDIAFAAGFGSVRQFNSIFKKIFGQTPTQMRKESGTASTAFQGLHLPYTPPMDFKGMLDYWRPLAVRGVERITDTEYARTFRLGHTSGYFTVQDNPAISALELSIHSDDLTCWMGIHNRVRRMFDLDRDHSAIESRFRADPLLAKGMRNGHVPRLPMAFDSLEFMARAIVGQQISVKAAATVATRVVERVGILAEENFGTGLTHYFPNAQELLDADLDGLGLNQARRDTLLASLNAVQDGTLPLSPAVDFDTFHARFTAIKGIGDWTSNYVAMSGLGLADSFPAGDLGVIKALTDEHGKPTRRAILQQAEAWRPWRAYATRCLWNGLAKNTGDAKA